MLAFLEIKKDIANGHTYMEYEGSWYGYQYCIIMDVNQQEIIYSFVDDNFQAVFSININKFLDIMWYKDYIKMVFNGIRYNEVPLEIEI